MVRSNVVDLRLYIIRIRTCSSKHPWNESDQRSVDLYEGRVAIALVTGRAILELSLAL